MKLSSIGEIVSALNRYDARYLIVGGLAVVAHGYGRVTFDLDLVLQLEEENVLRAVKALESLGYQPVAPVSAHELADPVKRDTWMREKNMVVFSLRSEQHRETPIDIFITDPFDFEIEYSRALKGNILPDVQTYFVSLQTLIHMKEETGRDKDREDVRQLKFLLEQSDEQP